MWRYSFLLLVLLTLNYLTMISILAIKPGPKPKKDDGSLDKRRRVTPPNQPKHPGLKPHKHKPGD